MEYKTLNNGISMPMVGLGVYNISERKTQKVVEEAIATGYRSIDTARAFSSRQRFAIAATRTTRHFVQ